MPNLLLRPMLILTNVNPEETPFKVPNLRSKNVITTALINSVNFEIEEHERKYHNVKQKI